MSLLTRSLGLHLAVGASVSTLMIATPLLYPQRRSLLYCQSAAIADSSTSWFSSSSIEHNRNPRQVQLEESSAGPIFNPVAFRQISSGSFIGLLAGVAIGKVSRLLAVVSLVIIFGLQFLESKGLHLIPYGKLQRYVSDVDAKKMVTENLPFKAAFGSTFLLAAFYPSR